MVAQLLLQGSQLLLQGYVGNQHYVFNIKGNNYRLVVVIMFIPGLVYIRWVGTHKEYDKIDCKNI